MFIIEIITTIGLLFAIEKEIKGKSDEIILTARQHSFKILTELNLFLEEKRKLYLPKEVESIHYILNHWQYYIEYTKHADGCCHNNASERAIRNVKVKLKVSGQFKSGEGAQDYATTRSIVDSAN